MVKITSVSVHYSRKFNLGNFEAIDASVTYWGQVDDDEDPVVVERHLMGMAKDAVRDAVEPALKGNPYQQELRERGLK